ncbi:MAG: thermonuclease family protein [bacterium]
MDSKKQKLIILNVLFAVLILAVFFFVLWFVKSFSLKDSALPKMYSATDSSVKTYKFSSKVTRVIDGDTVEISGGRRVRLLGLDTPETTHPDLPAQRFGEEAKAFTKKAIEGRQCVFECEENNASDVFGRILAYVYCDNKMVNLDLVKFGYAHVYTKHSNSKMSEFISAENFARRRGNGMWNYTLKDGRIAQIIDKYGRLNPQGRENFEAALDNLLKGYGVKETEQKDNPELSKVMLEEIKKLALTPVAVEVEVKDGSASFKDAAKYLNMETKIHGTIVAVKNTGKVCYLNFDKDYKKYIAVIIFAKNFRKFPQAPEVYYKNKTVTVSGKVVEYKGRLEIIVNGPEQLEIQ